jgi:outer membrane protein assembly factor BamB
VTKAGISKRVLTCTGRKLVIPLAAALFLATSSALADWPTHRGNPQRTGNIDGQAGPKAPKVLWVYKSQEHFVASPVVGNKELYLSGIGALNTAALHALSLDKVPGRQELWAKGNPYLKLPVVSPPAIADGKLVFGDGMHQTDGAVLHCLRADKGSMLWQLPLPGHLVHLEGAPTIANGRVYIGGGNAGVLCVDLNQVTLDGKELELSAVQMILDKKWKELQEKYEADKKKDPDFAVPPNDDMLPKPAPKRLWQQGEDKWHVDASVAVVGDRVLAASAHLEDEKIGDRALICLDAKMGEAKWKAALKLNPWSGPTISENTVLVGGSSIRFDPQQLKNAKGEITAVNLASGDVQWRKDVPGGVVSPVACQDNLLVFTATDGKVRCWDVPAGQEKWTYDAKTPLFAGPAIAGGVVYVADLKGVIHALNLANGAKLWKLDLATDPAVKAPGMVYGSPTVHGGRLYLATCNLEGPSARQATVVVCIGDM